MNAVFLDRDGVINRDVFYPDTRARESPRTATEFHLFPDVLTSLRQLQNGGYQLFLVSNQPNVAKAKSTLQQLQEIHLKFEAMLDEANVRFAQFYYCYHHPDSKIPGYGGPCECRKPSPYFLLKAAFDYSIDLRRSWMVGDRLSDIECGKRAGTRTILIVRDRSHSPDPSTEPAPNYVLGSLSEATDCILKSSR
jgi:D-glycero-D-manno-heptose 1,7-bisphosphate phosphatase